MKRKTSLLLFLFIPTVLGLAVLLAPSLLRLDRVRDSLATRLAQEMGQQVQVEEIRWHWLPVPRLVLEGASLQGGVLQASVPEMEAYPDWRRLLTQGRVRVGGIVLHRPQVRLERLQASPRKLALPSATVLIEHGSLTAAAALLPDLPTKELHFFELSGRLSLAPDSIRIERLNGRSSFSGRLELSGSVTPENGGYDLHFDARELELHKGVTSLAEGRIIPVPAKAGIQGRIIGTGLQNLTADIKGDLPCFLAEQGGKKVLFSCGFGDFRLEKKGGDLELLIRKLEVKEPAFELEGSIGRRTAAAQAPVWRLALNASAIDATLLREKLLLWWGDEKLLREVTGVVLGGEVRQASYLFEGPAEGFKHLKNMRITADVARADLHIPEVDLELSEAQGAIEIVGGVLRGEELKARMGESRGSRCSLMLELTGEEHPLQLDLALDADLADLPGVLHKVARKHPRFLDEVEQFSEVQGRAAGRLHLEGPLHHLKAEITVDTVEASARYQRLSWPLSIRQGRLRVLPHQEVHWQEVAASAGPHLIRRSAGSVLWGDDQEIRLELQETDARLEAAPLLAELVRYRPLRQKIAPVLTSAAGAVEVSRGTLSGPVLRPEEWKYALEAAIEKLRWRSPLLPQSVETSNGAVRISDRVIAVRQSRNRLFGTDWQLQSTLEHRHLARWQGAVTLSGTAYEPAAEWVKKKGWVPAPVFPRIPLRLRQFTVAWRPQEWAVSGTLLAGEQGLGAAAELDVRSSRSGFAIRRLMVTSGEERCVFSLQKGRDAAAPWQGVWQGVLRRRTADGLLAENPLLKGFVKGNFTLRFLAEQPAESRLDGFLEAGGLELSSFLAWLPSLQELRLAGSGSHLLLQAAQLQSGGQEASASGAVHLAEQGLDLDLSLVAADLDWSGLTPLLEGLQRWRQERVANGRGLRWEVGGRAAIRVERFSYPMERKPAEAAKVLTWTPLAGAITFHPGLGLQVDIDTADFCGLLMGGVWYSDPALGESSFRIETSAEQLPSFEEVMPCAGLTRDLITGRFAMSAQLRGTPGHWRSGTVNLHSDQGNIQRLTLLSKIFSVVNLTDLFHDDPPHPVAGGLSYSRMELSGQVQDNVLTLEKGVVRGEGLNLFSRGTVDLAGSVLDLTILIAPFKTIDAIVSSVPILGRVIGGENATLVTIPVAVEGPAKDPAITLLPPDAIGGSILNFVKDTLSIPFFILNPILPEKRGQQE